MQINDDGTRELKLIENLDSDVWSAEYGTVTDGVVWNPETDEFLVAMKDAEGNTYDETVINIGGGSIENLDKKDQYNLASMVYDAIAFVSGSSDANARPVTIYIGGKPTEIPPDATPEEIDAIGRDAMSKMGATDMLIDFVSNISKAAKNTNNAFIQNTAATIFKAGGGILQAFNGMVALAGIAPSSTDLGKFAAQVVKLGESTNTEEYQSELKEFQKLLSKPSELPEDAPWYEKAFEQLENVAGAISEYPGTGLIELLGVEAVQELAPLAIGGVAGLGAKAALKAAGSEFAERTAKQVAISAAATTDLAESFGGTAASTYDRAYATAIKSGMSEKDAENYAINLAVKSGTTAAVLTAASFGVGGMALEKAILGKDEVAGFGAKAIDELQARVAKGIGVTGKESITEGVEEGLVNAFVASHLKELDPSIDVAAEAWAGASIGALVGGSISGGTMALHDTGDLLSNVIKSTSVEYADLVANPPEDPKVAAAALKELGITTTADGKYQDPKVTGNLLEGIYQEQFTNTREAYEEYANYSYYTPTDSDILAAMDSSDANLADSVAKNVDTNYYDADEIKMFFRNQGYTNPTDEEIAQFVGQVNTTADKRSVKSAADSFADPRAVTITEAMKMFEDQKYAFPSTAQINQFVGQGGENFEADTKKDLIAYVDPRQVTYGEAKRMFEDTYGYTPTDKEVTKFVGQSKYDNLETNVNTQIGEYVDPRQVTKEEAKALFENIYGYTPTDEEAARFVGQGGDKFATDTITQIGAYVDPRQVTVEEAKNIFESTYGYTPTDEEVAQFVGQGDENFAASTDANIGAYVDPRQVTRDEAKDQFENTYGYTPTEEEIDQFIGQGNETFETDTGTNIGAYVDPRQVTEEEATAMFENYAGFDYEATPEEISGFVGQGGENFETSSNTNIDQYIDDNSITGEELVAHATELGYKLPEGVDLSSWATQQPESDIGTVFSEDQGAITYNLLSETMAGYEAQGIARDEALQLAIDDVATELGATKDELLDALGTTEQNLIDQIGAVETSLGEQITGVEESLTADIADLATQLGTTEENLTTQITDLATQLGTTEENLIAEIQSGDQNVINQLQEALTATETQLSSEIDAVSNLVGKPVSEVTDTDIDFVSDVIANATVLNEAQTAQYDVTGDGVVDNADLDLLNLVKSGKPATIAPTSTFAPTGLYESVYDTNVAMEQNQEATMDALTELQTNINTNINQEALRSGIRDLLGMAMAAPDVGGQTVQVRTPDKLNLDYIYDFSSIFANPQQQSLFPSPYGPGGYAQGGQVTSTTDKLLKILGD